MKFRRPHHAPVFAVLLGCWVCGQAPFAFAQPVSLAGRWQAEPMTVRWVIGEWGDACGPRPSGGGDPGGVVNIELKNEELAISGGERSYSSEQCWEMHPGLDRQSHAKGSRSWATTCRTKPNDSRQEILQTTITASDDVITFRESGQYQFSLQGQTCSASSGRWRTYRRLPAEAPAPTPPPEPEVTPPREPPDAARRPCANPGAPARIEVRPARKLMRAGESFSFRASVFDARGCVLRTPVSWELADSSGTPLTPGADPSAKLEGGALQIAPGAPDAELNVVATAASQSVRVTVGVVSNDRYASLLASGNFTADGASIEAANATITSGSFGAGDSASEPAAPSRKWTFVALVSGIALCFGVVGVLLLRRAQRQRTESPKLDPRTLADEPARPPVARAPHGAATRFDPVPAAPAQRGGTVCPICGTIYPSRDMRSCPKDGAQLLPINA